MSMLRPLLRRPMLARTGADFAILQAAALASLILLPSIRHGGPNTAAFQEMLWFYLTTFVPLSLLFPAIFWTRGVYTRIASYPPRHRWSALVRTTAFAFGLYVVVSFFLNRAHLLPRSGSLAFVVLASAGILGSRALSDWRTAKSSRRSNRPAFETPARPVLVMGGAGYIGSILCRKLLAMGERVRVLDLLVYGDGPIQDLLQDPNFELHVGDCRNIQHVVKAVRNVKAIIDLAAIVGDPACDYDHDVALQINYAATRMIIDVAKGHGISRFLFASSCSVYGATEEVTDEKSAVGPISLYAQTKVDSENALLAARDEVFRPTILRLSTVFGNSHRPRFDLVVNLLTAKAHRDGTITIYNGEQWRPFIHVDDVASAFARMLRAPLDIVGGEIFNIGDDRLNYTLSQLAEEIRGIYPHTRIEHVENNDRRNYRVSFAKVSSQLGYGAEFSLRDGILELKQALDSGEIRDHNDSQYNNRKFLQTFGSPTAKRELDIYVMAAFCNHMQPADRVTVNADGGNCR